MRKAIAVWTGMVHARTSQRKTELAYALAVNAVLSSATMMVLASGSFQVVHGGLSIGGLVAFYAYSTRMFEPVSSMMQTYSQLHRVTASIARVRSVLEREPVVPDRGKMIRGREALKTGISLENVSFLYGKGGAGVRQVSLQIAPGERLGMVGPSGSGKSTLARLMVRFADPQAGRITLDGHAIEKYSLAALRNAICYVPQSPILLNGSVGENLRYGRPEATENELHQALAAVELSDMIARLPSGLNTRIGPAGHTLSGGERQRLALARALLRRAPILVLDESTSALDLTTEHAVLEGIKTYCGGITLIIISHRVSSITWVDRVAVFDSGRIAQCGPPPILLRGLDIIVS
jgi:ABC-type multidrug transport system fused ATPase/permease subunit